MPLNIGQVLQGRYRIESLLGQGGMGAVYRGWHLTLNIPIVVKENLIHSPEAQRQFSREAGILANLRHPNLPRVTDHFFIPGQGQYLVMDYIAGADLSQILARQGPLSEAQALNWIRQVLDALEYLHNLGVIHRDIKPANVKITPQGRVFLVDFGLAKVGGPTQQTTIGARGVTPGFAPPEQYGEGHTDARSDLYSVGATLYAMLIGQPPPDALALVTGQAQLIPPQQLNPRISSHVEAAILRAMQTRPTDRFQTVAEFRAALTTPSRPPLKGSRTPSAAPDRRPRPSWLWAGGVLLLALFLAFGVWQLLTPETGPSSRTSRPVMAVGTATPSPRPTDTAPPTLFPTVPPPTSTPTPSPAPTSTPSLTAILRPTSSPAPTATPTPTVTPTPTLPPTPSSMPVPTGRLALVTTHYGFTEICTVEISGRGLLRLTHNQVYDWHPNWSPDGERLVFVSNRDGSGTDEIYVMNADGSNPVRLTNNAVKDDTPAWHPDSKRIFFSSQRDGNWEIYVMRADGTNVQRLTNHPALDQYPTISPDGQRMAFVSERDGNREIYVSNLDGSQVHRLTFRQEEDWAPAWSPDGDWIAFATQASEGRWNLYRIRPDGADLTLLTTTGGLYPTWSPDGKWLAFVSYRDEPGLLYRIRRDGSQEQRIELPIENSWSPAWSKGP